VLLLCIWAALLYPMLPDLDKVTDYQPRQPLQVFTRDGVEIAQFGSERRVFLPIDRIPKMMQDAVVSVEDARFREHGGVDPIGIARAFLANITPGGMRQGPRPSPSRWRATSSCRPSARWTARSARPCWR
jgi:penicillin-binding protein 1A